MNLECIANKEGSKWPSRFHLWPHLILKLPWQESGIQIEQWCPLKTGHICHGLP